MGPGGQGDAGEDDGSAEEKSGGGDFIQDEIGEGGGADRLGQEDEGDEGGGDPPEGVVEAGVAEELGAEGEEGEEEGGAAVVSGEGVSGGEGEEGKQGGGGGVGDCDVGDEVQALTLFPADEEVARDGHGSGKGEKVSGKGVSVPSPIGEGHHRGAQEGDCRAEGHAGADRFFQDEPAAQADEDRAGGDEEDGTGDGGAGEGGDPEGEVEAEEEAAAEEGEAVAGGSGPELVAVAGDGQGEDQKCGDAEPVGGNDEGRGVAEPDEDSSG